MKTILLMLLAAVALAETQHSATLTWADDKNPAGTTYNVYRSKGACSIDTTFAAPVNGSPVPVLTYTDSGVSVGKYCYVVRAYLDSQESADSNQADAIVRPWSVTITVTVAK